MTYLNQLREEIKLTSPTGTEFIALWIGDTISFEKKLGLFDTPGSDGTIAQDLGTKSTQYPLTIYFDGPFHNEISKDFSDALKEKGQWEIIHPVKGPLILQLIDISEETRPTENGDYTVFNTNWLEPANIERLVSADELGVSIITGALNAFDDAITGLQQLLVEAYSYVQSSINMFNNVVNTFTNILRPLTLTNALAQESFENAVNAFTQAVLGISVDDPDTDDTANSIINLSLAPLDVSTDFSNRYSEYDDALTELYTYAPTNNTLDDYNKSLAQQFGIETLLITIAQIVATSEFKSRSEVVSAIDNLFATFNTAIAAIEANQDAFSGLDIDLQYFAQTTTYTSLTNLYTLVYQYLLSQFFSLSAEKRFTLKNARSPLEISVTEYGSLGEDDFNYNLFLESNELSGTDILILPAGREVVVYV